MAQYKINYTCGHLGTEQLYGPEKDRERHIQWAERNKLCPDCYQAEQDRQRAVAVAEAQKANAGLPALKGSDKQIQWAETIRAAAKEHLALIVGRYSTKMESNKQSLMRDPETVPAASEMAAFAARILRQAEAKYWIDRRAELVSVDATARYLLRRVREEQAKAAGQKAIGGLAK